VNYVEKRPLQLGSSVESWTYDGTGNTTAYTNPLSQTISYTYDNAGRQTGVDYPTGTDTSFGYDDDDRTSSMVDATGTTSWTYNAADELTELDQPNGTVEYTYNSAGQRATMVDVGVGTTTYGYDGYGRLSTITNPYSEVTTFAFDAAGRILQRTLESDAYDVFTYDTRSRVTGIVTRDSEGNALYSRAYTFNAVSNVTQVIEGGVTTTYTYDNIDQLTGESRSGYTATYTYDANGNRLTKTLNSVTETYTYDSADKLLTAGSKTYDYDDAGRTTEVTVGGVTTYLTYDYEGRVTQISRSGSTTNTFEYNGLDTRTEKVDSAGTKTYRRSGAYVTDPVLGDGSANFTPGISERRSSTTTYLHSALKNADVQTGNFGSITGSRRYDSFGNVTSSSGSWAGPFSYAGGFGYQEDSDHGLKLLGHRYYDSSTGRFLTRDPAKDGRNWYTYCGSSPNTMIEQSGQTAVPWWKFEFTAQGLIEGYMTGMNAVDNHFGKYLRPWEALPFMPDLTKEWDNWASRQPGSEESDRIAGVGALAAGLASGGAGAKSAGYAVHAWKIKNNGWFGAKLVKGKKQILRVEVQQWDGPGQPWWQYPHFHKGGDLKKHFPWQWRLPWLTK